MRRAVRLLRESFPASPALDTAVSHALLRRVSGGLEPETLRLHRPGSIVAFGPKDRLSTGYPIALAAAQAQGFSAVERLAGGSAAVFHQQTIALAWILPDPSPRLHITARFQEAARIVAAALRSLGVDARIGEIPGEYCPGAHSVNARGAKKLMGVGQRLLQHAAHVGAVVVVGGSDRIRRVLVPVYQALGLEWDPATAGSIQDEVPGVAWGQAERAILDHFAASYDLQESSLTPEALELARQLEPRHRPAARAETDSL